MYAVFFTKRAISDIAKLKASGLDKNARALIELLKENPYQTPPPFETLKGDLEGAFSRRINLQHRLVYEIVEDEKAVKIIKLWTHYE